MTKCFGISPSGEVKVWKSYLDASYDLKVSLGQLRPSIKMGYKIKGWEVYDFPETIKEDLNEKSAMLAHVEELVKKYSL